MPLSVISAQRGRAGRFVLVCALGSICAALVLTQQHASSPASVDASVVSVRNRDASPPTAPQPELDTVPSGPDYQVASVTVERSFASAVQRAGLSAAVAAMLARAFADEIDFRRDLKRGNAVKFIFENSQDGETETGDGDLLMPLAVRIEIGPRFHDVFLFRDDDGNASYYPKHGLEPEPAMSRYPVAFRRISSHFAPRRLNPVTRRWLPHDGVDFAAPAGTPVYATADGSVAFVGSQTGYGNVVKLRHRPPYSTTFAHLSRFADGLRAGGSVKQGDVIGYVGSTGWSTAPHLHYEVRVNGVPQDPLSVDLPREEPIRTAELERFAQETGRLAALF